MDTIRTVSQVDIQRFAGDWYVQGHKPIAQEKKAYNAVENYQLDEKGRILINYIFNQASFEGELKKFKSIGFIRDNTNAHWGVQFIWPIRAEYRIVHLDEDYSETIIGRSKRDYAWIMTREKNVDEEKYNKLLNTLIELGYQAGNIRRVPQ